MPAKRNIVFVGFTATQEKLIKEDNYYKVNRFPKFIFIDNLEEALKHQGFMIIIKNLEIENFIDYDINNRHQFRKFTKVIICQKNKVFSNELSKIEIKPLDYIYRLNASMLINEYQKFLSRETKKKTPKREQNIERLADYLKGKRYVSKQEIQDYFQVSHRWVERYMQDIAEKYHNIGYIRARNLYYIVKNK